MMLEKVVPFVVDENFENVELHNSKNVINKHLEILKQLNKTKLDQNNSVVNYVSNRARSVFTVVPSFAAETVMFLYMFSYVMQKISSTTMIIDKVCLVHLEHPEDTCSNLKDYPAIKSEVEKMASNYYLGLILLQLVPASFLSLFIGSWSDKYGRKFPMIVALSGIIIDGFGSTLCAYFFYSRVEFYYIPAIFMGFSGGGVGVNVILYSYTSDVSNSGNRTMKYAVMEVAFGITRPLGFLVSGWIFEFYGYVPVFMTSTCFHILGLLCVIFFLEETRGLDNTDSWTKKLRSFFSFDGVKTSFRTTAKKRPNRGREQIWFLILAMCICIFTLSSLSSIAVLYVHHQFDWDNTTYSSISALYQVIGLTVMMITVPLSKKMKIGDPVLGIVGSVSLLLKDIGTGLASKQWIYHLANLTGLFTNLATVACRSSISKIVPKDDIGKLFAFLATAVSIFPIAAICIASQTFNATVDYFPGLIYLVIATLLVIPISIFIWTSRLPVIEYEEMIEEGQQDQEAKVQATEDISSVKY